MHSDQVFTVNRKPLRNVYLCRGASMIIENDVEKRLIKKVKALGGLTFKFTSPSTKGVPDRIVIFRGGVIFIELKRPGEVPSALQRYWLKELAFQGVSTQVISTFEEVDKFIAGLIGGNG